MRESARAVTAAQRREDRRARILDAAREQFETEGVGGLNIRAIAARAGMPAMTLYGYFPSKTHIVRALWAQAMEPLAGELDAVEAAAAEPKARLLRVSQALVDYWVRSPNRYRIVYLVEDRREEDHDRWFFEERVAVAAYARFAPLIAAARGNVGGNYIREAEALVCGLIGIVHMRVTISEYRWASSEVYVDLIVRAFV